MKLFLAPLQGITIAKYRNLFDEIFGGIDAYYTPFITTTPKIKENSGIFKDILPSKNNTTLTLVPQLLSNNGLHFNDFATRIVDMGYKEINWNIGCPFPMVTKKKKGSGILPYPDMIEGFLEEVCSHSSYSSYDLTVKMRLGLNDYYEGLKVIEILNNYPLRGVTIHGRTGAQRYTGTSNLDLFKILYSLCKHEITYNGDIFTVDDYNTIQTRFPSIDNFMIGRGALRDPFLPSAIKGKHISSDEKLVKINAFHNGIYDYYCEILSGDKHLLDKMKEFWTYLSVNLDDDGKYMKKIKKARNREVYLKVVEEMLFNKDLI